MKQPVNGDLPELQPLKFLDEGGTIFALMQNEVYHGKMHEELWFAEITKTNKGFVVRWQDNFSEPHPFRDLEDAKLYTMLEFSKHTAYSNGKSWEIDEG
jgi:hypothetical protein